MPSKQFDTTWVAEPHTIAKITILEAYLQVWFQIMGRTMAKQDIVYVDGFAGPGEYTNGVKGSPVAAFDAAKSSLAAVGRQWMAGNIHLVFIEADENRFKHLEGVVNRLQGHKRIKVHLIPKKFIDGLAQLKESLPQAFTKHCPLFVFIDPFGATGAPFSVVADILRSDRSEVLINFDADGIARILGAAEGANANSLLNEIYGNDLWQSALKGINDFRAQCLHLLQAYKQNLRCLPRIDYDFAFEMGSRSGSLNYYLVFASQHYLGLEKMKEAMKKVDQTGNYHFSDAHVDQQTLFRFDRPENYSPLMFARFKGKMSRYPELRDFALNETPFVNPKSMLKDLESKDLIVVSSSDPKRKKGTFNEEKIVSIAFKGSEQNGN
ncbi:MAG: three-Cys-motif partner protein TcmP [Thermodesulfovibrionales bacterium]